MNYSSHIFNLLYLKRKNLVFLKMSVEKIKFKYFFIILTQRIQKRLHYKFKYALEHIIRARQVSMMECI